MRYTLARGTRLESLGDSWAAYSQLSGETLLLNTEAAAVLECLAASAADESEVAATLAADTGACAADVNEVLRHVWEQLTGAGLIEAVEASEHNLG